MSYTAIKVEHLSKHYRLGHIGTGTLANDLKAFWAKLRGRPNPLAKLDGKDDFSTTEHWALNDINFEVKQGEAIGIIGRNGAGKSTLLKVLSRVTTPTAGTVKIKGRIASLLEVGTGFHPELSGRENIFLNGAILGMNKVEIRGKFDEIVDFSGVEKYIDTPVKRYSSGMYVRLAFAVAAHLEPEILIVDEVLAVGDAEFQRKAIGKMEDVSKGKGRTVLFVSHNMASIQRLCTKGLLLSKGKVEYFGAIEDTLEKYLNDAEKLGEEQMEIGVATRENENYGKLLKFERCSLLNSHNKEVSGYRLGERMGFAFSAISNADVNNISVVIGIESMYGDVICTMASEEMGVLYNLKKGEELKVMVRFDDLILNKGTYFLRLGARANNKVIDLVRKAKTVKVSEVSMNDSNKIEYSGLYGVVKSNSTWQLVK